MANAQLSNEPKNVQNGDLEMNQRHQNNLMKYLRHPVVFRHVEVKICCKLYHLIALFRCYKMRYITCLGGLCETDV